MQFHVAPEAQGQMIEVSFASDGESIYKLVEDRSDRSVELYATDYPADDDFIFEPWNESPSFPDGTEWVEVTGSAKDELLGVNQKPAEETFTITNKFTGRAYVAGVSAAKALKEEEILRRTRDCQNCGWEVRRDSDGALVIAHEGKYFAM